MIKVYEKRPRLEDLDCMKVGDILKIPNYNGISFEIHRDSKFLLYINKDNNLNLYFTDSNAFLILHRLKFCDYENKKRSLYN